jgi:hypothetical protein
LKFIIYRATTNTTTNYFDSGISIKDKKTELCYKLRIGGEYKINSRFSLCADFKRNSFGNISLIKREN